MFRQRRYMESEMHIKPFHGEGPGVQAQDGCSVELYRRMSYSGEIEFLSQFLTPGLSVLELGCGTGRLTRRLLSFDCTVTGVDNCAEMLAHAPTEARLLLSDIENLNLQEKFDVVILPTCLINHADPMIRAAFLASAARHLKFDGCFILERHDPAWLASAETGLLRQKDGLTVWLESVNRAHGLVGMTIKYAGQDHIWTHSFTLVALDESALQSQLHAAGFDAISWLDTAHRWACVSLQSVPKPAKSC